MSRPDPIQYAERLYSAIRAANFSPMSFLAFGNAVKEGISMRNMPRIAAEPFMRIVGEMLDLEDEVADAEIIVADTVVEPSLAAIDRQQGPALPAPGAQSPVTADAPATTAPTADAPSLTPAAAERRRDAKKR